MRCRTVQRGAAARGRRIDLCEVRAGQEPEAHVPEPVPRRGVQRGVPVDVGGVRQSATKEKEKRKEK